MRDYDEFVARLRREIDEADLGRPQPRLEGLEPRRQRSQPALRTWLAAAAAVLVAAGAGGYAGYDAWTARRLLQEDSSQFVDALFERGLLEITAVSALELDGLFEWTAAPPPDGAEAAGD